MKDSLNRFRIISFRGNFLHHGKLVSGDDAKKILKEILSKDKSEFPDGFYAFVAESEREIILKTDQAGTIPLFYKTEPEFEWADHPKKLNAGAELSDEALCQLMASGYVTGSETVYKDVFEVMPGSLYRYKKAESGLEIIPEKKEAFFQGEPQNPYAILQLLDQTFDALKQAFGLPKIRLSLSAGIDSRIIFGMLIRHDIPFTTFTYGTADNPEYKAAREISEAFGVRHEFHDYAKNRDLLESPEEMKYFVDGSFLGRSLPHEQDFLSATKFSDDSIFFGGHSGDLAAGSYISPLLASLKSRSELVNYLIFKHQMMTPNSGKRIAGFIRKSVESSVPEQLSGQEAIYEAAFRFNHLNRQRRYILNSVRAYDQRNIPFFLPLYTKSIIDFFSRLPVSQLEDQRLYKQFAAETLFTGKLEKLSGIGSTRSFKASFKKAGYAEKAKMRLQLMDAQKRRKRWLHAFVKGYSVPLRFIFPDSTDKDLASANVDQLFPEISKVADKLRDQNCPVAAEHLEFLKTCRGAQLNINGFYLLHFLPYKIL